MSVSRPGLLDWEEEEEPPAGDGSLGAPGGRALPVGGILLLLLLLTLNFLNSLRREMVKWVRPAVGPYRGTAGGQNQRGNWGMERRVSKFPTPYCFGGLF